MTRSPFFFVSGRFRVFQQFTLSLAALGFAAHFASAEAKLRWTVELPERQPMWRHVRDMQKDSAYRATAAGDLVFVGCEHNGALLALDAKTGEERWRHYVNGAIRTQPAADAERVCFGADDGFVHCLGRDGKLRWKAPLGLGQRFVIGHQRLTSAWPAPTHPLLADGKLYVMGGCWPADGVYMHAFDAATGKLLWRSPSMAMRAMLIPHWIHENKVYVRTYSGTGGRAARFDLSTGEPEPWPKGTVTPAPERPEVTGVQNLVGSNASGGLLFGSGSDGKLYCAGPALDGAAAPKVRARKLAAPAGDLAAARALLAAADSPQGYALVTDLEDGSLVEGLLRSSDLYVVAVGSDEAKVNRIRRDLDRRGAFDGHRLSVLALDLAPDVLPPYFASLVVAETGAEPSDVALLSLRPYGGTSARKSGGKWLVRRRGPLEGAGNWSHEYANAAMTNATSDKLVKGPLGILWYGGPAGDKRFYIGGSRPAGALVSEGRMFVQGNGVIAGVDAYTGRLLWEAETPNMHVYSASHGGGGGGLSKSTPWKDEKAAAKGIPPVKRCRATGLNWAVASDCLYLFAAEKCLRFDPATGAAQPAFAMPLPKSDGESLCWGCPRIVGDVLVATAFRPRDMRDARIGIGGNGGDWSGDRMPMSHVFAVNRTTGELLWSRPANLAFNNRAFAASAERVFLTDLILNDAFANFRENGRKLPDVSPSLRAFDLRAGEEVWSHALTHRNKYLSYSAKDDLLFAPNRYGRQWTEDGWAWPGVPERETRRKSGRPNGFFRVFKGKTGELVRKANDRHYDGPFTVLGDVVLNRYGTAFEPTTGKLATKVSPLTGEPESYGFKKSGCAVLGACDSLIAWRTAYHDVEGRATVKLDGFEAGCTTSLLPAAGLLNLPNFGMFHLRSRAAAVALAHRPGSRPWSGFQLTKLAEETSIRRIGYNLGAPGDRYDDKGLLWMRAVRGGDLKIDVEPKDPRWFAFGGEGDWIARSGVEGAEKLSLPTAINQKNPRGKARYHVRLHLAPRPGDLPGDRLFDLLLEGSPVLTDFDPAKRGPTTHLVENLEVTGKLDLQLVAKTGQTLLNGVELTKVE